MDWLHEFMQIVPKFEVGLNFKVGSLGNSMQFQFAIPHLNLLTQRKGSFPLRKITIGSDWTFSILYYPLCQTKKVENTSTLYHPGCGSNWNRKLVPKAHARVQFCSNPVRSDAYFPEWKPALTPQLESKYTRNLSSRDRRL